MFRGSIRHISHYLSTKWSKEPFHVGFPLTPDLLRQREEIHRQLFTPTFSPIYPRPEYATGIKLFARQTQIQSRSHIRREWSRLSQTERQFYETDADFDKLYQQLVRQWRGYEVVEHLKQYDSLRYWNPFPFLGLFPWEIVRDKLKNSRNNRDKFGFETDYYDILIREAFGRNWQRKARHIFYTDLETTNITWATVQRRFDELSPEEKQYYYDKEARRKEHALVLASPYRTLGFQDIYDRICGLPPTGIRPLLQAAREYQIVPRKRVDRTYTSSREYKRKLLELRTAIVLDYIYYVGGDGFDWRKYRALES